MANPTKIRSSMVVAILAGVRSDQQEVTGALEGGHTMRSDETWETTSDAGTTPERRTPAKAAPHGHGDTGTRSVKDTMTNPRGTTRQWGRGGSCLMAGTRARRCRSRTVHRSNTWRASAADEEIAMGPCCRRPDGKKGGGRGSCVGSAPGQRPRGEAALRGGCCPGRGSSGHGRPFGATRAQGPRARAQLPTAMSCSVREIGRAHV